jgi:hypothetical protein
MNISVSIRMRSLMLGFIISVQAYGTLTRWEIYSGVRVRFNVILLGNSTCLWTRSTAGITLADCRYQVELLLYSLDGWDFHRKPAKT